MDTLNCAKQLRGDLLNNLRVSVVERFAAWCDASRLLAKMSVRIPVVISATLAASVAIAQVCSVPGRDGTGPTAGVLNTYYSPVIPSGTTLTTGASSIGLTGATGAATALLPGDLVVVMQMQCATINVSNTSAYGAGTTNGRGYTNPASGCKVGTYEYVKAGPATTSSSLDLTGSPLANTYILDAGTVTNRRTFQIIRVPQYSSLTLSGNVQSTYWNGSTGGVVILDVAGQLTWNGFTIDVLGRGFRGGAGIDQGFTADTDTFSDYVATNASDQHAFKAEGIAGTPRQVWDQAAGATFDNGATWGGYSAGDNGRGAPGNAGGGGDNRSGVRDNGGGGGGGNGNIGGFGGLGWRSAGWTDAAAIAATYPNVPPDNGTVFNLRGIGGDAIIRSGADANLLVMGGGGGAGAENSNSAGTTASGGAGGGVVMVRAGAIAGTGSIFANGAAGQTQTGNDAAGGGGAGGSVLVWSNAVGGAVGALTVNVSGGVGGNSFVGGATAHGGGGGGSGGIIRSTGALGGASTVAGGANGITNTGDLPAGASSAHGASGGGGGTSTIIATDPPGFESGPRCLPALTVTKSTSTPARTFGVDTIANYSITVSNAVTVGTASGVNVVDNLPAPFTYTGAANVVVALSGGATGPAGPLTGVGADPVTIGTAGGTAANSFTLPPGGSVTLTFPVNLNGAAVGTYQNPAVANYLDPTRTAAGQTTSPGAVPASGGGTTPGSNYASASSTLEDVVIGAASLTVTKSNGGTALVPGQTTAYTVTIANSGAALASGVSWTDTPISGLTVTSITTGTATGAGSVLGTCTVAGCTGISVAAGGSVTYTVNATVTNTNTSAVNRADVGGGGCTAGLPSTPANCTSTDTDVKPLLTVTKTNGATTVPLGGTATYTVTIGNSGTGLASAVSWNDVAVAGLTVTGITTGTATGAGSVLGTCTVAGCTGISVAAGGSVTYTVTATVTGLAGTSTTNRANVGGGGCTAANPSTPANCTSDDTDLVVSPALTVTKSNGVTTVNGGSTTNYTVTITNSGPVTATGVTWTDNVGGGISLTSIALGTASAGSLLGSCTTSGCTGITVAGNGGTVTYIVSAIVTGVAGATAVNTANVGGGGCNAGVPSTPANCTSTDTDNIVVPDLTPNFTFSFTAYSVGVTRDVIININEINNVATSGLMRFFVPFSSGFTYAFDPSRTTASLFGPNDTSGLQNGDWTVTTTATGFLFASTTSIPAGGTSSIVISSTADVAGTKASITVNIVALSGGETRTNNNAVVLAQSVQR